MRTSEKKRKKAESQAERIKDWETPAYAGLLFSLLDYKDRLEEKRGFKLNSKPREIDIRIIDKLSEVAERMDHDIAYLFEKHNLVELKNPYEPLNIDVVWKGISYAAQYKSMGYDDTTGKKGVDAIRMKDVTLTFLRLSKPDELFGQMDISGYGIEQKFPGVYYITGIVDIKMQIVVGAELVGDMFVPLRVQKKNASESDIRKFMKMVDGFKEADDREMAGTIMQISISENAETYNRLKEARDMNSALRELMKDEIDDELRKAYRRAEKEAYRRAEKEAYRRAEKEAYRRAEKEVYRRAEDAAKKMLADGISEKDVMKYTGLGADRVQALASDAASVTASPML